MSAFDLFGCQKVTYKNCYVNYIFEEKSPHQSSYIIIMILVLRSWYDTGYRLCLKNILVYVKRIQKSIAHKSIVHKKIMHTFPCHQYNYYILLEL